MSRPPHRGRPGDDPTRRPGRRDHGVQRDRAPLHHPGQRARATEDDISQAIASGFTQGVKTATADGTLTAEEETNLRTFRGRMADHDMPAVITGSATLDRAAAHRITGQASRAALFTGDGGATLQELDSALRRSMMSNTNRRQLLIRAWRRRSREPSRTG